MKDMEKKKVRWSPGRIVLRSAMVLLLAGGLLLLCRSLVNRMFLAGYQSGRYAEYPEKLLLPLRLGEDYTVPYNLGTVAFHQEDFALAERYFRDALRKRPPAEEKECSVRINLALSILHGYSFDSVSLKNPEQVQEALDVLRLARGVLTESGCADERADAFTGHSLDAEALKRDIDDMIHRLLTPPPEGATPPRGGSNGDSGDDTQENQENQDETEDAPQEQTQAGQEKEQALREQLKEQKEALDTGSYQGSGARDFTYVNLGDMTGFGEVVPW